MLQSTEFFAGEVRHKGFKMYTILYTTDTKKWWEYRLINLESSYGGQSCIFLAILEGGSATFYAVKWG